MSFIYQIYLNCLNEEFEKKIERLPRKTLLAKLKSKNMKVQRCLTNAKLGDKYTTNT